MPEYFCLHCSREVRGKQHAISCDVCMNWQHRKCNTGISNADYLAARRGQIELTFTCEACNSRTSSSAPTPPTDPLDQQNEQTLVDLLNEQEESIAASMLPDTVEESMDVEDATPTQDFDLPHRNIADSDSTTMNTESSNLANTSNSLEDQLNQDFDLSHRNLADTPEIMEESMNDENLPNDDSDIPAPRPVTYEVLPTGSQRGGPLLISSDGYSYVKKSSNGTKTRWRCTVRSTCGACYVTVAQDGNNFRRNNEHNHQSDPQINVKRKVYSTAKQMADQDIFRPATSISDQAIRENIDEETAFLKPRADSTKRFVNRHRAKTRPQVPTDIHFHINTDFLHLDEFLIADIHMQTCRHLVFSTPFQLGVLKQARRWFIDGTFKIIGAPFSNGQLLSINAFVQKDGKRKQFPLVYAIMSRRSKQDYIKVLEAIKDTLDTPRVTNFVLDFEEATWRAIRDVFPDSDIRGCCFHWTQAVWRRVGALGLQPAYYEKGSIHDFIRQLLALPFLPSLHIPQSFDSLYNRTTEGTKLRELVNYIQRQWMTNAAFPVAQWSIYGHTVRTNNDVEAWHRRINTMGAGLSFYKLVPLLQKELQDVSLRIRAADLETDTRTRYTKQSEKIQEYWDAYMDTPPRLTTGAFLRKCSALYVTKKKAQSRRQQPPNDN